MAKTIADLLDSNKFQSNQHKALLGLMLAASQLSAQQQTFFKPFGLTSQQYNVLRILRGSHPTPCSIIQIHRRMMDKHSDVSRLVNRLENLGFVHTSINELNRRATDVSISEHGLNSLSQIDREVEQLNAFVKLDEVEAAQLITLLEKILE